GRGPEGGGGGGGGVGGQRGGGRGGRGDQGRRRAAVPLRRLLQGAQAHAAQGRAPLRPARLRQDHDRQGRRQQPRREDLREARREDQGLLPQHQGPRAPEQVRRRDRAQDPRDLR